MSTGELIEWYPWGEEAFCKAKDEKKPIFLSIGYSTAHWYRVMIEESFEDKTIAELLNKNFISIKVDSTNRPDIDKYYKNVYKLMNGQNCASPITVFMSEDLEPFYTAAYIAPYPKGNVLGFQELLNIIIEKYTNDKANMVQKGREVLDYIDPKEQKIEATRLNIGVFKTITAHAKELMDKEHGGFGDAPKFPHTSTIDMLFKTYELTQNRELLDHALFTLKKMANGQIYDATHGGFYRYTDDSRWDKPHLEKISYDNANLAQLYIHAYQITKDDFYKKIAFETINFMITDMSDKNLFYANALYKDNQLDFIDTKLVTSWSAMMIDTLFKATTVDKKYHNIAINSLEVLLEKSYINGTLYHTKTVEAFLEDYAYFGVALLSAYRVTQNEEYLILAQTMLNSAIEKFYEYGRWRFSNGKLKLYDDIFDTTYPSAIATILELLYTITPLVESDYSQYIFKTLEMNSYTLMRQPFSSPKTTKALLLYLKDDIIQTKQ